ncbi:hypothetical protein AV530_009343 [Patagioenas fasciata monilis]|uniref:Uncharacterized protein n=1 Tax=Patagioenas fasciata monilis TaxID=372326 RepID=A0A1V4JIJ6_PATFA|nr:hypothetical protein AV530_009343 [Patagioenas fasciata monilis]
MGHHGTSRSWPAPEAPSSWWEHRGVRNHISAAGDSPGQHLTQVGLSRKEIRDGICEVTRRWLGTPGASFTAKISLEIVPYEILWIPWFGSLDPGPAIHSRVSDVRINSGH